MLRVRVLGQLAAELDGRAIEPPVSRRAWALLGFLALRPGLHPRAEVAARLWPDVLDQSARASMRSALWSLRRALGPGGGALVATRDRVGLDRDQGLWVDIEAFEAAVRADDPERAAALCHGDLLAGIEDEWALEARDLQRARLGAQLRLLAERAAAAGDHERAVAWARRALAVEAFSEDALRLLMQRLAAGGDRASAVAAYERFRERLARELRALPSAPTRRLAEELRAAGSDDDGAPRPATDDGDVAEAAARPVAQRSGAAAGRLPPLRGRRRELRLLEDAWDAARGGVGGAATVVGGPGIGKSRLVAELTARVAADGGACVARCAAPEVGAAPPFGLWTELLGELLRELGPPPDSAWWRDLAPLVPANRPVADAAGVAPELERARLSAAVADCLEWAAGERPLLLVLEDVHAADGASVELAAYAGRRLARLPILLVLTHRERPVHGGVEALEQALRSRGLCGCELRLGRLDDGAVAELARAIGPLGAEDAERVAAVADGNPLLAVEAARALARGEPSLPRGLRAAARVAAAGLDGDARAFVDAVAVAGREVAFADARTLAGDEERLARDAEAGEVSGLLTVRPGGVGFRHALLREAIYAELPETRRRALHRRMAGLARAGGDGARAAEAAHHLQRAGESAAAVVELVRAARHARTLGALEAAADCLDQAIALQPDDPQLALTRAEIEAWAGRHERTTALFDPALARLAASGDRVAVAHAHLRYAEWHSGPICMPRVARDAARRALAEFELAGLAGGPEHRRGLASLAWAEAIGGDPDAAERLVTEIETDAALHGDDLVSCHCATARALALIRRGRFRESYDPGLRAAEVACGLRRPDIAYGCLIDIAGAAVCSGDHERAIGFLDRATAILRGQGMPALDLNVLQCRGLVLARMGRTDAAREAETAARELADRIGADDLRAAIDCDRGWIELRVGELERAAALLGDALAGSGPFSRPLARLWRAEALARLGRPDEAEEELRATALEPVGPGDWPDTLVARMAKVQGLVARARGDRELALRRLREAAAGWRRRADGGSAAATGEAWAGTLADIGRPLVGVVEPRVELDEVLEELRLTAAADGGG